MTLQMPHLSCAPPAWSTVVTLFGFLGLIPGRQPPRRASVQPQGHSQSMQEAPTVQGLKANPGLLLRPDRRGKSRGSWCMHIVTDDEGTDRQHGPASSWHKQLRVLRCPNGCHEATGLSPGVQKESHWER